MIKQPIGIVDCVDDFGRSTNSFSNPCFDSLDSLSHLKTFTLPGSIAQVNFESGLLMFSGGNWLLFSNFSHLHAFCEALQTGIENPNVKSKTLLEENVKELCEAKSYKDFCELCKAAPYVIVQLQNMYQNNEIGIPGVEDIQGAIDILSKAHKNLTATLSTKKRKNEQSDAVNKKPRIDDEQSEEDEKKNELTLEDVLGKDEAEQIEEPVVEERQSFGVRVTVFAHNESFRKLFNEPKKVEAIRELTFNKFRQRSDSKNSGGKSAQYADMAIVAAAIQASNYFDVAKKFSDTPNQNLNLLQPPLMESSKLFPVLTNEHGFRFPLFDYQRRLLHWMLYRERQTLLFAAWPAVKLDETTTGQLDDVAIAKFVQVVSGDNVDRNFFLSDGQLTLFYNRLNQPRIKFSHRNDEVLSNFCDKACPSILNGAHYPHQVQRICRMLFGSDGTVTDEFLSKGLDTLEIPAVYVSSDEDNDVDDISTSSSVSIVREKKSVQVSPSAAAELLNRRVICSHAVSGDCHGECKEVQEIRSKETAELNAGTELCPLPILVEALLRSAQSTSMLSRQVDARSSTRRVVVGNPTLFPCGVSCGKTGCGKTTMQIALIYVTKIWEDSLPETSRQGMHFATNYEALLPIVRRPLKLSANSMTAALAATRNELYYANCTLVICPEQVVEQWFMEFVKTIGCGTAKPRPATGKNRGVLNGGVFGEITDDQGNILLRIAVIRDAMALRQVKTTDIIESLDVVIVNQTIFRSPSYRENFKRNPVNRQLVGGNHTIGSRLFEIPQDHAWIRKAVRLEREAISAAETKLEQSMIDQQQYDFDSVPKPGFGINRTLLHAIHWRRVVIDEAHLLSTHITPVERGVASLSGDFTWLVTATANFQSRGAFRRFNSRNEGGYGVLLHLKDNDNRTHLETNLQYRGQFVQQCSATTTYDALPQLYLHRVNIQMTPAEMAIYSSLRSGKKQRMLRLLFCSHHMLNDQAWVAKNLTYDEREAVPQSGGNARNADVVGKMMTVNEVAASMQSSRREQIEEFNRELINFNRGFSQSWIALVNESGEEHLELLNAAKKTVEDEITTELELAQNEPENISEPIPELTLHYLGTITDAMLEQWQKNPEIRVAMTFSRLENDIARRAVALRARYTINSTKVRQPILRQRERTLAEFDFFRRIFERLSKPDEIIDCPVCLTDDHTKKSIVLTVCGHEFCTECSKALFTTKPQCGVCRRELRVPRDLRLVDRITISQPPPPVLAENKVDKPVSASVLETYGSKLAALISLIHKILKRRDCRKIIVYAQFQRLLVLIAGVLEKNDINFVVAKGSIRQCEKAFRSFRYDNNVRLILLSSEKSISGVHLVEANHMIAVHPTMCSRGVDEEVATFMQAVARMRRLMQQNDCHVWQMVTRNTIEEQQYLAQNTVLRAKYAMDVGIHWNAPEEEETTEAKNTLPVIVTAEDKSRQEFVNLLNGNEVEGEEENVDENATNLTTVVETNGEEMDEDLPSAEELESTETQEEQGGQQEEAEGQDEKVPLNEWLSKGKYRK